MSKGFKRILYALLIASMMMNPVTASASEVQSTEVTTSVEEETTAAEIAEEAEGQASTENTEQNDSREAADSIQEATDGQTTAEETTAEETTAEESSTEESSTEESSEEETTAEAKNGLIEEDGKLYYYQNDEKVTGMQEVDGKTYYFQKDGAAFRQGVLTFTHKGKKYTMNFGKDGSAQAGYAAVRTESTADAEGNVNTKKLSGIERYYFRMDNKQAFNQGYLNFVRFDTGKAYNFYFGSNGRSQTGYKSTSVKYFADAKGVITSKKGSYRSYFRAGGTAFANGLLEFQHKGKTYKFYFGKDGLAAFKGYSVFDNYYKADPTTFEVTNIKDSGRYYIDSDGRAFAGGLLRFVHRNNKTYTFFFGGDGKIFNNGYKATTSGSTADKNGVIKKTTDGKKRYYYFMENGAPYTGGLLKFKHTNNKYYYFFFTEDGSAVVDDNKVTSKLCVAERDCKVKKSSNSATLAYHFDKNGHGSPVNGWAKINNHWRYADDGEVMFTSDDMHSAWTKIKDRSSATRYFVVVDTVACRTFTFTGSAGNWKPKFLWKCGPGRDITPTVKGTFTVGGRGHHFDGKNNEDYTCYYYTQFYGNYLFHSILYHRNSWNVKTATLGRKVSHGCVRLETENAYWFYKNLPSGTKVYIY